MELKKNGCYWCWWMSRILIYKGVAKEVNGLPKLYQFEDFGDCKFLMTPDQVDKLGKMDK